MIIALLIISPFIENDYGSQVYNTVFDVDKNEEEVEELIENGNVEKHINQPALDSNIQNMEN